MENKELDVLDLTFEQKVDIIHYTLDLIGFVYNAKMSEVNRKIMHKIIELNDIIDEMFDVLEDAQNDENTDDFEVFLAQENMLEGITRLCMQFLGVSIEEILEDIEEIKNNKTED